MKRKTLIIIIGIVVLVIVALAIVFGNKAKENGTYYPNSSEMKKNLEKLDYSVLVENNPDNNYVGTRLYAIKNDEYIEFYWLDDSNSIDKVSEKLKTKYNNPEKFVTLKDDSKFGNLILCGTKLAVEDSGIKIVDVKVKEK